jgi:hypothetical protein
MAVMARLLYTQLPDKLLQWMLLLPGVKKCLKQILLVYQTASTFLRLQQTPYCICYLDTLHLLS